MHYANLGKDTERDLAFYRQVARLHMEGINQGFLPQLGIEFMTLLYDAIDHSPTSVLLAETDRGRVIGFVSGSASMKSIYIQLLRNPFRLFFTVLPSLFRPRRLRRIYEIIMYSRQKHVEELPTLPVFELLSIVVAPDARGTGCADRLYKRLLGYCEDKQIEGFKIVVGSALKPAHSFYQRMGAVPTSCTEVHVGEKSVVYTHMRNTNQL